MNENGQAATRSDWNAKAFDRERVMIRTSRVSAYASAFPSGVVVPPSFFALGFDRAE